VVDIHRAAQISQRILTAIADENYHTLHLSIKSGKGRVGVTCEIRSRLQRDDRKPQCLGYVLFRSVDAPTGWLVEA
jgi:hypothetical protein